MRLLGRTCPTRREVASRDVTATRQGAGGSGWHAEPFAQECNALERARPVERTGHPARDFVLWVWQAFVLKLHLSHSFKLSTDPHFVEKVRDVVGFCLDPPDKALVLCVDEKSQIQVLDRTQRMLSLNHETPETSAHHYPRYGTTTLFAALGVVTGKIKCRHRDIDFISFLRHIDHVVPENLEIHLILNNYGTHKIAKAGSGCCAIRDSIDISHRLTALGSIWGRAFLCQFDRATVAAWKSPLCLSSETSNTWPPRHPQRATQAIPLDKIRGGDNRVREQRS